MVTQEMFNAALEKAFERAVKKISEERAKDIYNAIYRTPNKSGRYERTGGFLNSIRYPVLEDDGDDLIAMQNFSLIKPHNGRRKRNIYGGWTMITFGHYRSWPWDSPYPSDAEVRENLYDWLNDGFTIFKKVSHPGFDFDEDYEDRLSQLCGKYLAEELNK